MVWKNPTPEELALDWIASRRIDPSGVKVSSCGHLAQFLLSDFPEEEPELTWQAIILVMGHYPTEDFFSENKTEAQQVCGVLSAGPVEDLLSYHGDEYIDQFEALAKCDRRMGWLLGGTWQFRMSDEIWDRVCRAGDLTYWTRRSR